MGAVGIVVFLTVIIQVLHARIQNDFECYVCNSQAHSNCKYRVEENLLADYKTLCSSLHFTDGFTVEELDENDTFECLKSNYLNVTSNTNITMRTCIVKKETVDNPCDYYQENLNIKVHDCQICDDKYCNSAPRFNTNSIGVLISFLLFVSV